MPDVYYPTKTQKLPSGTFRLPKRTLKSRLESTDAQRLIPFLGAGASLRPTTGPMLSPPAHRASPETLQTICSECRLDDPQARRFVEVSLLVAQLIQQRNALIDNEQLNEAPSSWQLARRLANMISLEPLRPVSDTLRQLLAESPPPPQDDYLDLVETVARVLGLAKTVPQLLTVASYFNNPDQREELVRNLVERFAQVRQVTPIQRKIGETAKNFVLAQNALPSRVPRSDYLIITTNYDQLMELHLMDLEVPTCVLRVDKKSNVLIDFMPGSQDFLKMSDRDYADFIRSYREDEIHQGPKAAKNFNLTNKQHSVAMIYKIHGCPVSDERHHTDNVVISDQDYVLFIQKNGLGNELIPAYIGSRAMHAGFLFLGYSFADWNVRSLYEQFVKDRKKRRVGGPPVPVEQPAPDTPANTEDATDYIVIKSYDTTDDYFFRRWKDIAVVVADLDELAAELTEAAPPATSSIAAVWTGGSACTFRPLPTSSSRSRSRDWHSIGATTPARSTRVTRTSN